MRNLGIVTALSLLLAVSTAHAQEQAWVIESLSPTNDFVYDLTSGTATGTNGVIIKYGGAVMVADQVTVNQKTGSALADGHVRIQRDDQVWVGEHISYNFMTRMMEAEEFRSGKPPVFVASRGLSGDLNGQTYTATNAVITTDNFSEPAIKIRARRIKMVPGKYIEARDALLLLDDVPVFYLPYYRRNLGEHASNFNFTPGYRSRYGAFLLTRYNWYFNDEFDANLRLDYRTKRGVGVGPDFNYHLGPWGDGSLRYYYLHDDKPDYNANGVNVPHNRQRVEFSYLANPATNLSVRSQVRYQSDPLLNRDFFEGLYGQNSQPSTYIEINKFWDNFSLDTVAQPRINDFQQTVERLPDVRLTGYRQQLGNSPVYYESESSFAYLRERFAISNGVPLLPAGILGNYAAARADTYHQLLLPYSLFGWLNVVPHTGGRFTYYSEASGPGATNNQISRGVFDAGLETSFKVSRTWPGATNHLFDMSGLRHILEPSADYIYVPSPNRSPSSIPQFDSTLPSLRLLPNEFPEMNSIDSIDSENVVRLGVKNKLQTKRNGDVVNLANWEVYTDWNLRRSAAQTNLTSFSDVYSDLTLSPRNWLTFESQTRYDTADRRFRLAYHTVTFQPNNTWSWSLGHFYVHDDPVLGTGNNLITSRFYYRVNENWGAQIAHQFEARTGRMQEQDYTIYRDLRSLTAALTFRVTDNPNQPTDYTVALTFSLKAIPRFRLGDDSVRPYSLFGGG